MIWAALFHVLIAAGEFLIGLLPDAGNLGLTAVSGWLPYYNLMDQAAPLHETVGMLAIYVTIWTGVVGFGTVLRVKQLVTNWL